MSDLYVPQLNTLLFEDFNFVDNFKTVDLEK